MKRTQKLAQNLDRLYFLSPKFYKTQTLIMPWKLTHIDVRCNKIGTLLHTCVQKETKYKYITNKTLQNILCTSTQNEKIVTKQTVGILKSLFYPFLQI